MGGVLSTTSKPQAPATVPTDTIVPLNSMDDTDINRSLALAWGLRFDDVLDPEMLRSSLEKLFARKDWGRLGARMRLNAQGKLEYHIPAEYTPERPAFAFSHVNHDMSISEHPLASKIPRPTPTKGVVIDGMVFGELLRRPDGPRYLEDWIYRDEPQISVHVVSFTDATLVSLNWLHTFWDAMGRREFLTAWSLVLNGRESEVKPFRGIEAGALDRYGKNPTEKFVAADKVLKGWGLAGFAVRYIFDQWWYPEVEHRTVCLPAEFIKKLKTEVNEELAAQEKGRFASEGDIVSAYAARLYTRQIVGGDVNSNRIVAVGNAYGLRELLAGDIFEKGESYVGNCVSAVMAHVPAKDMLQKPLSHTAYAVRRSIAEQGTREQQEAFRATSDELKGPVVLGTPDMLMIIVSNWSKAKFFETDFSAAVVKTGLSGGDLKKVGRPSGLVVQGYVRKGAMFSMRNAVAVSGRDLDGNVWIGGELRKGFWGRIEEELKRDFVTAGAAL
ncbi:transcriptional regulator sdnM [Podospora australis]|uniref:Transcriptional regulator sdnM n=1 Tax=Podospora australis TaxID=1536484 RepID=A0AAN6WPS1_9PEZI|nr:transcriptional regulator sdnM [Podospora australis]